MTTFPRWQKMRAEFPRKAIHCGFGVFPLGYGLMGMRPLFICVYALMAAVMTWIEWMRSHRDSAGAAAFQRWFGHVLREKETAGKALIGATPYSYTGLVIIVLFPQAVAVLSLLYLAVGDAAASMIGIGFGRIKLGRKTVEGGVAFWLASSAIGLIAHAVSPAYALVPALAGALAAAVAELVFQQFEDNVTVPVACALTMTLVPLLSRGI